MIELKLPLRSQLQRYSFLSGIPGYPAPIGIISSPSSESISASCGIFDGILNINIKHVTTNPSLFRETKRYTICQKFLSETHKILRKIERFIKFMILPKTNFSLMIRIMARKWPKMFRIKFPKTLSPKWFFEENGFDTIGWDFFGWRVFTSCHPI